MTSKIIVSGGRQLYGDVVISGSKNAALPILFATILVRGVCTLENVPPISDIQCTLRILADMGAEVTALNRTTVRVDTSHLFLPDEPHYLTSKLRASTYLLGAELGRFGRAVTGWPGGCKLGDTRPVNLHFKAFDALGAKAWTDGGFLFANAENGLHGNAVYFDFPSVGATANTMLASVLAEGTTVIENAAREPHIVDLANFLNTCGADIMGAGTSVIKIHGVKELHGCAYTVIPDMIEAGTYMVATAATGGRVLIRSVIPKHLETITAKLTEMGVSVTANDDSILVEGIGGTLKSVNIITQPYPGFPTDMQPQFAPLLALADNICTIQDGVFQNRFRYVEELQKMNANVMVDNRTATFIGSGKLVGARVFAPDLRAGAALIIAGLIAEGQTEISGVEYIERGYCDIVKKLRILGADIATVSLPDPDEEQLRAAN